MIIAVMMEVLGFNPKPDPAVAKEEESDYRKEKRERQKKSAEEKKRLVEPDDSCGCWYVDSWEEAQAFYRYALRWIGMV
ncbi:hypothetical protein [Melghirimyces algeriensis]|uniref:Uncharacterized protein n=1 Tax=Melghirimyces algeriensis TaxID=910412 RepID=A0A521BVG4_9BACL|nr:hypothetical protein [Melghirimyces algeriensis]SMO51159.1 hypothetical protein SAMN06264849_102470 [Melghirimyces algeriensis]